MRSLREVRGQLRACGASSKILTKGETKYLPNILHYDEHIASFIYGVHPGGFGMLVATNKRLIFINKMLLDTIVDDLPYGVCQAIEYDLGVLWGKVTIFTPAKNFEFSMVRRSYVLPFVNQVQQRMMAGQQKFDTWRSPVDMPSINAPQPQTASQRPALGQLRSHLAMQSGSSQNQA